MTQAEQRVLVLAPSGRDAALAVSVLEKEKIGATICADAEQFCTELQAGAAAGLSTEELLLPRSRGPVLAALERQPLWSDFPLVVLAARPPTASGRQGLSAALAALGNVTVLDRPLHAEAMVSAVRSALRARGRQYQARELLHRLQEGMRERDHFLAILSHELRNPLAAIRNATHLMARAPKEEARTQRALTIVERQTNHLGRLVDDLLDVSRVMNGKVALQKRVVDLRAVVTDVLQQMDPTMKTSGRELVCRLSGTSLPVEGDSIRLEQIVTNLLTNALKYTPRGGRIEVRLESKEDTVCLTIADTGVGIAPEMLLSIFDLFSQADQSLDRSHGGMGIGLTLVRSLVEMHGGQVTAFSAGRGQGAEFRVTLPLLRGAVVPKVASASTVHASTPRNVLVVEDNPDARESLQALLQLEGHKVDVAADGLEAVERALTGKPELAIIDIGLPGMDGFEVARRLRAAFGRGIFLVALTGYGQPEDRRKSAEAGFDAHLTKPAGLPALETILSHA